MNRLNLIKIIINKKTIKNTILMELPVKMYGITMIVYMVINKN